VRRAILGVIPLAGLAMVTALIAFCWINAPILGTIRLALRVWFVLGLALFGMVGGLGVTATGRSGWIVGIAVSAGLAIGAAGEEIYISDIRLGPIAALIVGISNFWCLILTFSAAAWCGAFAAQLLLGRSPSRLLPHQDDRSRTGSDL
jgi:hypothetical protein